jgi:hypothetical protein
MCCSAAVLQFLPQVNKLLSAAVLLFFLEAMDDPWPRITPFQSP